MDTPLKNSPGQSSPEEFELEGELEDDSCNVQSQQWPEQDQKSSNADGSAQQPFKAPTPMQKRRRVTRACDECRRKKIKCDGKQPCTHCTVYSYDCTYDQPSNRRRNPAPQYIEALENRLQRAEALLRTLAPNIDLNDPNFEALLQQKQRGQGTGAFGPRFAYPKVEETRPNVPMTAQEKADQDAKLRVMIDSTGHLDLDEDNNWDFHGSSSGAVFLHRMREKFGGLLGAGNRGPLALPRVPRPSSVNLYESPSTGSAESPWDSGLPNTVDLPSKETARQLCENAFNYACAILRFVHTPSFWEEFEKIYETPVENFGNEEHRFLPLLYSTLAVGCMFFDNSTLAPDSDAPLYKTSRDQGFKYLQAARHMMEITDCRDLTSLQAIIFMILFLQSSANLSVCYVYIGVALRSAIRLGLHRNLQMSFNPIEREIRRRLFWTIRKMDAYIPAILGFPRMLHERDVDQVFPLEVDDEYITKDDIKQMPPGSISSIAASNLHTLLMRILAKTIEYIYPTKGAEDSMPGGYYSIGYAKIKEVECDLQEWSNNLPMAFRPGGEMSTELIRIQQLLRMGYAHVQMMLYRPFLHYISPKSCQNKNIDKRSYACAAACIHVSRNIVHITSEMEKRGVLIGAYWFSVYTTFFAILSLVYFVTENPEKPESQEYLGDATTGYNVLKNLAIRSMAADRCMQALAGLFEQLPAHLKQGRTGSQQTKPKKRAAPSPNPSATQANQSMPALFQGGPNGSPITSAQRAKTFPTPLVTKPPTRQSVSLDLTQYPPSAGLESTFRQPFSDTVSPSEMSAGGTTPDSGGPGNGQRPGFGFQGYSNIPDGTLPDLSAMMFPSADPFAYPNQALMEFDNLQPKDENRGNLVNETRNPLYMSNGGLPVNGFDNLDGQLFGPLPPYLMQGQPNVEMGGPVNMGGAPTMGANDLAGYGGGIMPNTSMNLDDIFNGNNEEWAGMLGDQGFRL